MLAQSEYRPRGKICRLKGVAECYHKVVEEKQCVSLKTLAVTGRDLIQAGYKPGPELGEVLKEMLEHVLEEPSDNTKEKLMEFIKENIRSIWTVHLYIEIPQGEIWEYFNGPYIFWIPLHKIEGTKSRGGFLFV